MAGSSLIGNLAVNLTLATAAFEKGASAAEKRATQLGKRLEAIGESIGKLGQKMTIGITAPLAGIAAFGVKMAADFETAMTKVEISSQATGEQLKQMSKLALDIGKDTTFGASEAAEAMDMLAKTGLSAEQILGGAARAVTNLAAAAGSELEPAASAISDAMAQFSLTTKDLPKVVNQITGAVNESKLSFEDFTGAAAQAGGIAGSLGVSFEDFNAAIAATSPMFQSGSDAGTSFKNFLLRLTPATEGAATAMQELGLDFYDANGSMKSMSEIAEILKTKLGGLNEEALKEKLTPIFGTDAMRAAIGLMRAGGKGIDEISAKIGKTDAAAQAAKQMTGFNAQMDQMKGALETLAIRIGQSGILEMLTGFVRGVTDFVDRLSTASPAALKFGVALAAIAAAVGPLLMVFGPIVSVVGKLVPILAGLAGGLTTAAAAAGGLLPLLAGLLPVLLPIAAVAGAAYLAWKNWDTIGPMVAQLWKTIQTSLGPPLLAMFHDVKASLTELWNGPFGQGVKAAIKLWFEFQVAMAKVLGPVALALLKGFIVVLGEVFESIGLALNLVASLLKGDFGGAWEYAQKLATNAVTSIGRVIQAMVPGAIAWLQRLWQGAKTWLVDKMWDLVNLALAPIRKIEHGFAWLYDKVVGHSYIPDMVDQIGAHMRRLDAEMVQPAKTATEKTAEHFRALQSLLAELYPEEEAYNRYLAKLARLEESLKRGEMSAERFADALRRLKDTNLGLEKVGPSFDGQAPQIPANDVGSALDSFATRLPKLAQDTKKHTTQIAENFAQMAEGIVSSLQRAFDAFKNGGFWDKVQAVLGVVEAGAKAYMSAKGGGAGSFSYQNRVNGGSVISGRTYQIGENGKEFFRPNFSGRITPNNDNHGGVMQVVPSPYFDLVVDGRVARTAGPMVGRAAVEGSSLAQRTIAQRQRRGIP